MTEMLDRVTKAIGDTMFGYVDPKETPTTWGMAQSMAEVAIQAMEEPTEAMIAAGEAVECEGSVGYRAMVRAALKP